MGTAGTPTKGRKKFPSCAIKCRCKAVTPHRLNYSMRRPHADAYPQLRCPDVHRQVFCRIESKRMHVIVELDDIRHEYLDVHLVVALWHVSHVIAIGNLHPGSPCRSEERRVGKGRR